jgi:hypothetical protein
VNIESIIYELQQAQFGSPEFDAEIAQIVGWKKSAQTFKDMTSGEIQSRTLWLVPNSEDPGKVPSYTSDLAAAYQLVQEMAPHLGGGCSWEDGKASAKIGPEGIYVQAATPAIALCIAALLVERRRGYPS